MFGQVTPTAVVWADGHHEAVDCLVFATGFRPNISFLEDLAVTDDRGRLMQRDGRALHIPGLYFMGLPKQRNFASATLRGVGAEVILPHLLRHLRSKGTELVIAAQR